MNTLSTEASRMIHGQHQGKTVGGLPSRRSLRPKALRRLPTQYRLVVVVVTSHLSVETGDAVGAAWHGRDRLVRLSTASTAQASHRKICPFSALSVPGRSRQNTSGSVTKTLYMRFELLGYAVTQNQPQSWKCAPFVVKPVLTMRIWPDTGTSSVGASPNLSELFTAATTLSSICITYTLGIASIHLCGLDARRDCLLPRGTTLVAKI